MNRKLPKASEASVYCFNRVAIAASSAAAAILFVLGAPAAVAQDKGDAEPASYIGADRQQRLQEGAKKEGELTVYTSATSDDMAVLTTAFEKKYGIKVKVFRADSQKVLQRALTESQANRYEFDAIHLGSPELETMHRAKILQPVKSPAFKDMMTGAVPAHNEWAATLLSVWVPAYNTKLIKKEDLPKTYRDLLNPKFKGKLGIEAEDYDWFAAVLAELGEDKGVQLFRAIVATNGMSVRKGHTNLANLVASGEVPLALTVYNYKAEQLKNAGAAMNWFVIPPAIARANGVAISKRAPHPHAAVLFFDFMLTDAQQILAHRDYVPTSKKVFTPLSKIPLKIVDPKIILDENAKWTKLFDEVIGKPLATGKPLK